MIYCMRHWFNGRTSGFQPDGWGSIPQWRIVMKKRGLLAILSVSLLASTFTCGYVLGRNENISNWIHYQAEQVKETSLLFEKAEMIARSKEGNNKEISSEEHFSFLKELGLDLPETTISFKGRASYGIDYSNGQGIVWVELDGKRIGHITRLNLENYLLKNKK